MGPVNHDLQPNTQVNIRQDAQETFGQMLDCGKIGLFFKTREAAERRCAKLAYHPIASVFAIARLTGSDSRSEIGLELRKVFNTLALADELADDEDEPDVAAEPSTSEGSQSPVIIGVDDDISGAELNAEDTTVWSTLGVDVANVVNLSEWSEYDRNLSGPAAIPGGEDAAALASQYRAFLNRPAAITEGGYDAALASQYRELLRDRVAPTEGPDSADLRSAYREFLNHRMAIDEGGDDEALTAAYREILNYRVAATEGGDDEALTAAYHEILSYRVATSERGDDAALASHYREFLNYQLARYELPSAYRRFFGDPVATTERGDELVSTDDDEPTEAEAMDTAEYEHETSFLPTNLRDHWHNEALDYAKAHVLDTDDGISALSAVERFLSMTFTFAAFVVAEMMAIEHAIGTALELFHRRVNSLYTCLQRRILRPFSKNVSPSQTRPLCTEHQEPVECSICLSNLEETDNSTKLTCGHAAHAGCLLRWTLQAGTCPLCRQAISVGDVIGRMDLEEMDEQLEEAMPFWAVRGVFELFNAAPSAMYNINT